MISVEEATRRILSAFGPLPPEVIGLERALGRVLAADVAARLTQPWAAVSAMDGYAVRSADVARVPVTLSCVGAVPAGGSFDRPIGPGECVRIFTGAPLPDGADAIVIQEDTDAEGSRISVREGVPAGRYIRPAGLDFRQGDVLLKAGRLLTARDIGLAAAMNVPWLTVHRQPRVAILATGDEIVMPGEPVGRNQIVSSNGLGLAALVTACGGLPINLGIARDDREQLSAMAAGGRTADLLITTGGASVGEHDLIHDMLGGEGLALNFWKIAMRPGKPLMFGRVGETPLIGLPGNPVSSMVCGLIFVRPALRALQGQRDVVEQPTALLGRDVAANDRRQDYLRSTLSRAPDGQLIVTPFERQDSSMTSLLAHADCLVVRPPLAPPAPAGTGVPIIPFATGTLVL